MDEIPDAAAKAVSPLCRNGTRARLRRGRGRLRAAAGEDRHSRCKSHPREPGFDFRCEESARLCRCGRRRPRTCGSIGPACRAEREWRAASAPALSPKKILRLARTNRPRSSFSKECFSCFVFVVCKARANEFQGREASWTTTTHRGALIYAR